jgi:hypothetical protein
LKPTTNARQTITIVSVIALLMLALIWPLVQTSTTRSTLRALPIATPAPSATPTAIHAPSATPTATYAPSATPTAIHRPPPTGEKAYVVPADVLPEPHL